MQVYFYIIYDLASAYTIQCITFSYPIVGNILDLKNDTSSIQHQVLKCTIIIFIITSVYVTICGMHANTRLNFLYFAVNSGNNPLIEQIFLTT